jgi:hypothetical protein
MADNPLLAATKAAQASRASSKEQTNKPTVPSQDSPPKAKKTAKKTATKKPKEPEKMTTIKIPQSLARGLADRAQQVRNNNTEPVAPSDRVYPAHLVQATLEHLLELPIDWDSIKSVEDFQQVLKAKND